MTCNRTTPSTHDCGDDTRLREMMMRVGLIQRAYAHEITLVFLSAKHRALPLHCVHVPIKLAKHVKAPATLHQTPPPREPMNAAGKGEDVWELTSTRSSVAKRRVFRKCSVDGIQAAGCSSTSRAAGRMSDVRSDLKEEEEPRSTVGRARGRGT